MASTLPTNQAITPGCLWQHFGGNHVEFILITVFMSNNNTWNWFGFFFLHILKPVSLGTSAIFPLAASITFLKIIKTHHLVYCEYWTCRGSGFPFCLSQMRKLSLRGNEIMPNIMQCRAEIWHAIGKKYLLWVMLGIELRNVYTWGRSLINRLHPHPNKKLLHPSLKHAYQGTGTGIQSDWLVPTSFEWMNEVARLNFACSSSVILILVSIDP